MAKPVVLALAIAFAVAAASPVTAQLKFTQDEGFQGKKFTFRTVKPPAPGARKRIVLQKDSPVAAAPRATSRGQSFGWFWGEVDAALAAADPARFGRLTSAYADRLSGGWAGFGGPDRARDFALAHRDAIAAAAKRENLSPAFILAVIAVESAGQTRARSPKGAQGLMQLMPATARRFAVANPWDATQNIAGGAAYLDFLLGLFNDDPVLALAGYNAGEGAVEKHKGVPPYAETRDYVPKVLAAFLALRSLCAAPPAGVRDDCAFFAES